MKKLYIILLFIAIGLIACDTDQNTQLPDEEITTCED